MKIATVGIVLLTTMVTTKYVVSLYTMDSSDGSFKDGIALNFRDAFIEVTNLKTNHTADNLLASNSMNAFSADAVSVDQAVSYTAAEPITVETVEVFTGTKTEPATNDDEPISMDHRNSMVVYDISNPMNNLISSNYDDVADDIPLDNGNTVVSGMMQMMPRR